MRPYQPVDQTRLYAYMLRLGTFGDKFDVMELIETWRQEIEAGDDPANLLRRHALSIWYMNDLLPI